MFLFKTQRLLAAILYICTIIYSVQFWFLPAIQLHGGWTVLYTMLALFTAGFLSTYMFFSAKRPQATPRPQATYYDGH